MNFTTDDIQMIRNERRSFEETREISDHLLEFIYSHQLFKLIIPEALGGKMLDLPSAAKIFQKASYIDGNFGWLVTIGSGAGMFVPNMIEETSKACYSPRNAIIAGSGFPAGTATPTDNGYILNGKWFYCSGAQFATTFTVSCIVDNGSEDKNEMLAFALEPHQVGVLNDWDAFGLKGTSSHSIQVVDQFVPEHNVFSVFEDQNTLGGPVHAFPFDLYAEAGFAAITLGIGRHFLEEVETLLEKNKENWQNGEDNRYPLLQDKLQNEKARWEQANETFHETLRLIWDQHIQSNEIENELKEKFTTVAKRSATTSVYSANQLFRYIGMQAVMETNSLNQIWRDLYTASQHAFLTPYKQIESTPF